MATRGGFRGSAGARPPDADDFKLRLKSKSTVVSLISIAHHQLTTFLHGRVPLPSNEGCGPALLSALHTSNHAPTNAMTTEHGDTPRMRRDAADGNAKRTTGDVDDDTMRAEDNAEGPGPGPSSPISPNTSTSSHATIASLQSTRSCATDGSSVTSASARSKTTAGKGFDTATAVGEEYAEAVGDVDSDTGVGTAGDLDGDAGDVDGDGGAR
ncbi:hypothetical protein BJ912DRAFT_1145339 [Pholiota molesta]|nr:hypothetical protein BJ912DRAFT_1145339 [Pholiota molesta]